MARTSRFSSLFSLRKKQIDAAFSVARRRGSMPGIKVLHALSNDQPAKVLIVPTRGFKGHVKRNKIRRQIKSIVYEDQLAEQQGTFIVLLYADAPAIAFSPLRAFLQRAFRKKKS